MQKRINPLKNKSNIDEKLRRIANFLSLHSSFIDNVGLLSGKMGISIFFFEYGRYCDDKLFTDYAGELIDEIYENINTSTPNDFKNGLTGIGWGIEYLVRNKFIDADTDEALAEIDNSLYRNIANSALLLDSGDDLFGCGHYFISRLHGRENDDDNLNTLVKKEHLIYLTDECEKLLVHKRYLEFNILQLSVATINSLLWFLLEIERIGLFPAKVRKILSYLPDYISNKEKEQNNYADWMILKELVNETVNLIEGAELKQKYKSLYARILEEVKRSSNKSENLLADFHKLQFQKLIYTPYANIEATKMDSFSNVLNILNSGDEWNNMFKGINQVSLGLSGLAGTGLLLLETVKGNKIARKKPKSVGSKTRV